MQTPIFKKDNTTLALQQCNYDDFSNLIKKRTGHYLSPQTLERIVKIDLYKQDDYSNVTENFNDLNTNNSNSKVENKYSPNITINDKNKTIAELEIFRWFMFAIGVCFVELIVIAILVGIHF